MNEHTREVNNDKQKTNWSSFSAMQTQMGFKKNK